MSFFFVYSTPFPFLFSGIKKASENPIKNTISLSILKKYLFTWKDDKPLMESVRVYLHFLCSPILSQMYFLFTCSVQTINQKVCLTF